MLAQFRPRIFSSWILAHARIADANAKPHDRIAVNAGDAFHGADADAFTKQIYRLHLAGRKPDSGENTKICVSVNEKNWNTALKRWQRYRRQRKPSWLVDKLIAYYVSTGGSILETETAI
jgi:hypothetical protein